MTLTDWPAIGHNEGPDNYVAWHEWAERMSETHVQSRCPACGLWAIWTPRPASESAAPTTEAT